MEERLDNLVSDGAVLSSIELSIEDKTVPSIYVKMAYSDVYLEVGNKRKEAKYMKTTSRGGARKNSWGGVSGLELPSKIWDLKCYKPKLFNLVSNYKHNVFQM